MCKSKNILLIDGVPLALSITEEYLSGSRKDYMFFLSYPMSIMTIAGWCKQELTECNLNVLFPTLSLHKYLSNPNMVETTFEDFIVNELKKINDIPDYIGISFGCSTSHKANLVLVAMCKKIWPNVKIIVGGMHVTTFTHRIIENENIDFVIRGAGDVAFIELIKCLMDNKNPENVKGVVTGTHNLLALADKFQDLDLIPRNPYEMIDMEYLLTNDSWSPIGNAKGARTAVITTSRGCMFCCTYCSANLIHGKKVSFISVEKVIDEIKFMIDKYKINQIAILDDLFGANKNYFYQFFNKIKEENLKFRFLVGSSVSIKIYDENMIDTLIENGLDAVYFALESGSKYVQDVVIKKKVDLEKATRLLTYSRHTKKIYTGVNIVLGCPGETKEMMYETYEFLKNLPRDWINFSPAFPFPGTEITNTFLSRGDVTEDELIDFWDKSLSIPRSTRPFDTPEISGQELADLVYDFNIKLNFFYNYNFMIKDYNHILPKFDQIVERYPFHVVGFACRAKCYYELGLKDKCINDIKQIYSLITNDSEAKELFDVYEKYICEFLKEPIYEFNLCLETI